MKEERLHSLDLLRGLDMFLLAVIGPFATALDASIGLPDCIRAQFHHAWGGFSLWDMIMPLFIFMSGAATVFALPKRIAGRWGGLGYWRHVLWRFAMLWVLGMVAQGRLLTLDATLISPFNNTLQSIACGYLAAAAVRLVPGHRVRAAVPVALAAGYAVFLHFLGDYSQDANAAMRFERWFVPFVTPAGSKVLALADPGYTWWATIPMFAAMALCGAEAVEILRSAVSPVRRLARLAILGVLLFATGLALSPIIPPVKHIYTFTFSAMAMGLSCLALALCYLVADVFGLRRGLGVFDLFGRHSLLAYMCEGRFRPVFTAFGGIFAPGAAHQIGRAHV